MAAEGGELASEHGGLDQDEPPGPLDGEVVVLGVAGRGSVEEMRGFVDDTGTAGFTHLADTDGTIWREFGVVAQPAFAFVAPDGDTEVFVGALDEDDLRSFVGDAGG